MCPVPLTAGWGFILKNPVFQDNLLERETGFEPATACLEGRNSTAELLPPDALHSKRLRLVCQRHKQGQFQGIDRAVHAP